MANEKAKKSTSTTADREIEETVVAEELTTEPVPEKKQKKPTVKDIDPHELVVVRNGFQGRLLYKSTRTGETYIWDSFGAEQEMELLELRNAKNSKKKFFIMNWFMFDEAWIIDYLGVGQYYKHSIPINQFDDFFKKSATEIRDALEDMPDGQKRSLAYRARQLIAEEKIDSNKVISALEKGLGVELIEHHK